MRWDIRRPWRRFADRFVLSAGHTVPLVYATLAVLNEALRARHERDGDPALRLPRRRPLGADLGGPAHVPPPRRAARATPRWTARPSSSSSTPGRPATACRPRPARRSRSRWPAPRRSRSSSVEGEGGLTPGATHETRNSACGPGPLEPRLPGRLERLRHRRAAGVSSVVYGTPEDWFAPHGWRVIGTPDGMEWGPVTRTVLEVARGDNPDRRPVRGLVQDPQGPRLRQVRREDATARRTPLNSPGVLGRAQGVHGALRRDLRGRGRARPDRSGRARGPGRGQPRTAHLRPAPRPGARDLAVATGCSRSPPPSPTRSPASASGARRVPAIFADPRVHRRPRLPGRHVQGARRAGPQPGRASAAGAPGSTRWPGTTTAGRSSSSPRPTSPNPPTSPASARTSATCRASAGTSATRTRRGAVLPQEITEFANAGIVAGMASVNFADDPFAAFDGFWGACSTYGSFSYLKYGPMRLFSQLAQDTELRLGRLLWVAGHSGPGDGRGLAHPLRHLRDRRHPALPERRGDRPAPVGAQRGAGHAGGRARDGRADRRAPPDPAAGRDPRSRGARDAVALRGGARRLRAPRLPAGPAPDGHGLRPGHGDHGQPGLDPARARRARAQRQDRRGAEPAALRAARTPRIARPSPRPPTAGTPWRSPTARSS